MQKTKKSANLGPSSKNFPIAPLPKTKQTRRSAVDGPNAKSIRFDGAPESPKNFNPFCAETFKLFGGSRLKRRKGRLDSKNKGLKIRKKREILVKRVEDKKFT